MKHEDLNASFHITTVSYVNKQKGTRSYSLNKKTADISQGAEVMIYHYHHRHHGLPWQLALDWSMTCLTVPNTKDLLHYIGDIFLLGRENEICLRRTEKNASLFFHYYKKLYSACLLMDRCAFEMLQIPEWVLQHHTDVHLPPCPKMLQNAHKGMQQNCSTACMLLSLQRFIQTTNCTRVFTGSPPCSPPPPAGEVKHYGMPENHWKVQTFKEWLKKWSASKYTPLFSKGCFWSAALAKNICLEPFKQQVSTEPTCLLWNSAINSAVSFAPARYWKVTRIPQPEVRPLLCVIGSPYNTKTSNIYPLQTFAQLPYILSQLKLLHLGTKI